MELLGTTYFQTTYFRNLCVQELTFKIMTQSQREDNSRRLQSMAFTKKNNIEYINLDFKSIFHGNVEYNIIAHQLEPS